MASASIQIKPALKSQKRENFLLNVLWLYLTHREHQISQKISETGYGKNTPNGWEVQHTKWMRGRSGHFPHILSENDLGLIQLNT